MAFTVIGLARYCLKRSPWVLVLLGGVTTLFALPDEQPLRVSFPPVQLGGESQIWQLVQGPENQVISGGERIGFYQNGHWEFLRAPKKSVIRSLVVDGNTLWISSPGEIGRMQLPLTAHSTYEALSLPQLKDAGNFWELAKEGNYLVASTSDSFWSIDLQSMTATHVPLPNKHRVALVRHEGRLLVIQAGVQLWEVKQGKLNPVQNPLSDPADTFWIWADANYVITALAIYHKEADGTFRASSDFRPINHTVVVGIARWNRFFVFTTFNQGTVLFDPATKKITSIGLAPGDSIPNCAAVMVDAQDRLWTGSSQGITLYESLTYGHRIEPGQFVASAARQQGLLITYSDHAEYHHDNGVVDQLGRVFVTAPTPRGLAIGYWDKVGVGPQQFDTPANGVSRIAELPDGNLIAHVGGERLYLLDLASGQPTLLTDKKIGISGVGVFQNRLRIATEDHAVYDSPAAAPLVLTKIMSFVGTPPRALYDLDGTLITTSPEGVHFGSNFTMVAGTSGLTNPKLAKTNGVLWLTGFQAGVQRLGKLQLKNDRVAWETVDAKGIAALSEVHDFSANEGVLTFCGDAGILELNVSTLKSAYRLGPPPLRFIRTDSPAPSNAALSPPTTISADDNSLTFTGAAVFDEFGEKPGFERRLLPTETNWTPTKRDEVVNYPSLSSRTYTLEVRATHLGKTGEPASYTFTVLPPWYASKTAVFGYVLLAFATGYAGYRLRSRQIIRRNQELELLIQDRTRDLAKASAAKSEFLASMSHEIRNPMNGVVGLVTILRDQSAGNPRQMHTLKLLYHCAEQLRATVDDILDFSKIEAGEVRLESVPFNLLDTIEAAAATVEPSGHAIRFLEKPPSDLQLEGDAAKLRQIFANYLSNALKYGVPPEARVGTIVTPTPGGLKLTLSVTSSGPTIDKDTLDKFFESFTRGEEAKESNIRGTGLGLAICRRYARAMGGDVGAVSTNGETTFYFNAPFRLLNAKALIPVETVPAVFPALPAKALAIEDEDYNRIVLGSILTKMNYTVDWATTGQEALRLARENGYDIILTDYRLPDTNGVDLTKEILRICPDPKPAVFAVTAYSTRERRQECLDAGMSGFISKPITLEKLRSTIANWGEKNLAKLSLETTRPYVPPRPSSAIEHGWRELKSVAQTDGKHAAELAHRLNNLCRSQYYFDLAEQLELLEGALERSEPSEQITAAIERLLHPGNLTDVPTS